MEKIKIGIETNTIASKFGEEKALELIKEAGFDCFDFSFFSARMVKALREGTAKEKIQSVKRTMERLGLQCNQTHAPMNFHFGQRMELDEPDYRDLVASMECASMLGAKYIVVHSCLTPAGVELVDYNVRFFKSLEKYCQQYQIRIGFENIFDFDLYKRCMPRFATAAAMNDILARLESPWFVCCCDVGHAAIAGTMPQDFIRGMDKSVLRLLHIQDTDYVADCHVLPYMQKQDWDEITSALGEIGYEGDFTFEVGNSFQRLPPELCLSALRYAHDIGRYLTARIEKVKAQG